MTVPIDRRRILIVDDDPGCRALLDAISNAYGLQITATDSVLGASELVERLRPDVIVLDLALPYRSGASWLSELKSDPVTAHIPVIILSAHPMVLPDGRRRLAHAVLAKPFQTKALLAAIRSARAYDLGDAERAPETLQAS